MEGSTLISLDDSKEEAAPVPEELVYTGTLVQCKDCNLWFSTQATLEHHQCTQLSKVVQDSTGQRNENEGTLTDEGSITSSTLVSSKEHVTTGYLEVRVNKVGEKIVDEQTGAQVSSSSCVDEASVRQTHDTDDVNLVRGQEDATDEISEQIENHIPSHQNVKTSEMRMQQSEPTNIGTEQEKIKVTHGKDNKRLSKNYFKCSKCSPTRTFASGKALQKHHTRCHTHVLEHTCHSCGHCFKHPVDNVKSIRTVYTQTDVDAWMCEVCCKALSSFDEIQKHKLQSHNGTYKQHSSHDRFVCKFCSKTYQFQCQLKSHELVHTNTKPHKCPYCSKSFRLKGQLDTHVNVHTKQTIYNCGECSANFYQATALHHHLRSKHQEWKFKCGFCQKGHVTKNDMLEHERIHTGVKPYICEECGVGFSRKQNLNNHLKAHRNERLYPCGECGKAFSRKSTLKEHFRTHIGEKPYQCQRCNKRFTQKSHLRAHLRSHLRQELERHQPVNESETANTEELDNVDVHVDNKDEGIVNSVDASLENQTMPSIVTDTLSECVVDVTNDNSGSDTQTAGEDDELVINTVGD